MKCGYYLVLVFLWSCTVSYLLGCEPANSPPSQDAQFHAENSRDQKLYEELLSRVKENSNVNEVLSDGLPLLSEAARLGQENIVRVLLGRGADPNFVRVSQANFYVPVYWAISTHKEQIARLLIDAGANMREMDARSLDGWSALHEAASAGETSLVDYILDHGGEIDWGWNGGNTALMEAASGGHVDTVRLLIKRGANVNAVPNAGLWSGQTALHQVAGPHAGEIVDILVRAGANMKARDPAGRTPLQLAALGGNRSMVARLLSAGANVHDRDKHNDTPLLLLSQCRGNQIDIGVAELLVSAGADINAKNDIGATPLTDALDNNHGRLAQWLRQHGAHE